MARNLKGQHPKPPAMGGNSQVELCTLRQWQRFSTMATNALLEAPAIPEVLKCGWEFSNVTVVNCLKFSRQPGIPKCM
jgi:hypothetical protein